MASFAILEEDMKEINDEQQGVVLDALVAAAWADGAVRPSEIKRFEQEVVRIPWGKSHDELKAMIYASTQRVSALKDRDAVFAFIKSIADKLPNQTLREKLLHTMVLVMYSDKDLNEEERNVVAAFGDAFGIGRDRFHDIAASVLRKN
jgi:uncharacterized tellurite resistance protein B-like protein